MTLKEYLNQKSDKPALDLIYFLLFSCSIPRENRFIAKSILVSIADYLFWPNLGIALLLWFFLDYSILAIVMICVFLIIKFIALQLAELKPEESE